MAHFTGYLLGKVQLDGAIRSEVLASLVETLVQKYQTSESTKKQFKFNENHKYSVECSERGLKLTSPGYRSKDEGFESDCESVRSVKITEAVELDLSDLIDHLEIGTKDEKQTDSGAQSNTAPSSPGGSMDNGSITSSSGIHVSDDSNSSSGNGSDSDEFGASGDNRSPYWETLPNLSSFQSYLIEDVVFCHCDCLHPSTLVWVVRHLEKMIALVTAFRTRSEAEELFQTYRDLRVKLKPIKYKINPILGIKIHNIPPPPNSVAPSPPSSTASPDASGDNSTFTSLPPVYPTEILHETHHSKSSALFSYEPKSLGFELDSPVFSNNAIDNASTTSTLTREPLSRTGSNSLSLHTHVYVSNPNIVRNGPMDSLLRTDERDEECNDSTEDNSEEADNYIEIPLRPQRKVHGAMTLGSSSGKSMSLASVNFSNNKSSANNNNKPVLLVPLKTESVSAPKSTYPKESYLYHVMGRSSSTFAPYQRSLNFLPQQYGSNGSDYVAWGNGNGGHLLVPFSSWLELSEMPKTPHAVNSNSSRKQAHYVPKGRVSSKNNSRLSSSIGAKGTTSKILLRDAAGRDSMWASLSQRFKKNFRETLIPKLNGMWSQPTENGRKKRTNKKVTFNAWATVQMV